MLPFSASLLGDHQDWPLVSFLITMGLGMVCGYKSALRLLLNGLQDLKQLSASQCQLASLYAFTVPEILLSSCGIAISHWETDVAERCLPTAINNVLTDQTITSCRLAPHNVQI